MIKIALSFLVLFSLVTAAQAQNYTNGYYKRNGQYVQGYYRSSPNSTVQDNYSYKGNYNPYTGSTGDNYYRSSPTSAYYNPYNYSGTRPYSTSTYRRRSW